ncbi:MAG TPA: aldose 1-epimerase, partial [Acidobacteriaceae bacterium]
ITDPKAGYGLSIAGISPQIKTVQTFAPPAAHFVAIEHQFNFADPFGKEWGGRDTGMVTLQPGKGVEWHVRLFLFVP